MKPENSMAKKLKKQSRKGGTLSKKQPRVKTRGAKHNPARHKKQIKKGQKIKKPIARKIPAEEQKKLDEQKVSALLLRGRQRGFITYGEILQEFPRIEQNILLLEELYQKLEISGVDVLEEKGFIEFEDKAETPKTKPKKDAERKYFKEDVEHISSDSVQMYL
ncbi:MAG: RNA polymerase primary sigma factor, partial [Parcubacteria group bacterium Gr01-1014_70]